MAEFDLPAMVEFILLETKASRISYVGHSQGSNQMIAALSDPSSAEYLNSKIDVFVALAPVIYFVNRLSYSRAS